MCFKYIFLIYVFIVTLSMFFLKAYIVKKIPGLKGRGWNVEDLKSNSEVYKKVKIVLVTLLAISGSFMLYGFIHSC